MEQHQHTNKLPFAFAIVQLMGRQKIAGHVTEEARCGTIMLRVDVPAVDDAPGFTRYYTSGAIYDITPVDQKTMMAAAKVCKAEPTSAWIMKQREAEYGPILDGIPDSYSDPMPFGEWEDVEGEF